MIKIRNNRKRMFEGSDIADGWKCYALLNHKRDIIACVNEFWMLDEFVRTCRPAYFYEAVVRKGGDTMLYVVRDQYDGKIAGLFANWNYAQECMYRIYRYADRFGPLTDINIVKMPSDGEYFSVELGREVDKETMMDRREWIKRQRSQGRSDEHKMFYESCSRGRGGRMFEGSETAVSDGWKCYVFMYANSRSVRDGIIACVMSEGDARYMAEALEKDRDRDPYDEDTEWTVRTGVVRDGGGIPLCGLYDGGDLVGLYNEGDLEEQADMMIRDGRMRDGDERFGRERGYSIKITGEYRGRMR